MKEQITFEQYNEDILVLAQKIAEEIKSGNKKYSSIYGIPRGGYYVAIELSNLLSIPVVNKPVEMTLIVDDICDSGATLAAYKDHDKATVYVREASKGMVTYYGMVKDSWLLFPDEKETGIEDHIRRILSYIGENPNREGLIETPDRIARMYNEIFRGYDASQKPKITTFKNDMESTDIVFDSGDYYSMCEHHMMPFFGKYYFAYIPKKDGRILGISKVARVVGYCAARLQLQERLARDIIQMLTDALDGQVEGMAIVMRGAHLCKTMRGVKNNGKMTVSHLSGVFKEDPNARNEFYKLIDQQKD
jgi:GTP cyclohydrolase I